MNFKRHKPNNGKLINWGSPKELQAKVSPSVVDGIVPYRHFPNRKFCKVHKGEHQLVTVEVRKSFVDGKYFLTTLCACGKKGWDYRDEEALSQQEAQLLALQTAKDGSQPSAQALRTSNA